MSAKPKVETPDDRLTPRARYLAGQLAVIANPTYQEVSRACLAEALAAEIGWDVTRLRREAEAVRRDIRPTTRCDWLSAFSWLVGDEERLPRVLPHHQQEGFVPREIGAPLLEALTRALARKQPFVDFVAAALAKMPPHLRPRGARLAETMAVEFEQGARRAQRRRLSGSAPPSPPALTYDEAEEDEVPF